MTLKCILDISGSFTSCEHTSEFDPITQSKVLTPSACCQWRSHQQAECKHPYSQLCSQQRCECRRSLCRSFLRLRSSLKQRSFGPTRPPVDSTSGGTAGRPGARLAQSWRSEGKEAADRATEIRPWTFQRSARPRLWRQRRSALRSCRPCLSLRERKQVEKVNHGTSKKNGFLFLLFLINPKLWGNVFIVSNSWHHFCLSALE